METAKYQYIKIEKPDDPSQERLEVRMFDGTETLWKLIAHAYHKPYTKGGNGIEFGHIFWLEFKVDLHPELEKILKESIGFGSSIQEAEDELNNEIHELKTSLRKVAHNPVVYYSEKEQ